MNPTPAPTPSATPLPHEALFDREGAGVRATPLARGPWDANALHGGPVAALCAWAAEQHDPGPAMFVSRLTVELLRPVPLGFLDVHATTFRPGGRVQWIDVRITDADERLVAAARALRLARRDDAPFDVGDAAIPASEPMPRAPAASEHQPIGFPERVGFWLANEFRMAAGDWQTPGPSAAWLRLKVPVIAGETVTPLQRVAAAADFGTGVGNAVRMSSTATINPELTVHLHRAAVGEWIGLAARAWAHAEGVGLCETALHDEQGPIGRGVQSLLVVTNVPWRS
jgi:acyl-coenzyme A thioesterase PaaI-like protein